MSKELLKPKLFTLLKSYRREDFTADLMAGTIVAIVALPLAIAFAIASGVSPDKGLVTAIIAGFLISALGGSRVQIGGPTGAFVIVVYSIVSQYGVAGLTVATLLAGCMLVLMGVFRLGSVIKFIPHPLIVGFTSGIALIIFSSQIKDFFGLNMPTPPADFIEKWISYAHAFPTFNWAALGVGLGSLALLIVWPRLHSKIPGSLVVLVLSTLAVHLFHLPVETIGSRFGDMPSGLPLPSFPTVDFMTLKQLIQPAFSIALLAAIESLLSAVVADGMIGGKHRSNMELVGQGAANIASALFGGIPATGALARTAVNIRSGARTPVAGMVHAVILLLILLFFGRFAKLIPLPALAAILVIVSYYMSEWRSFRTMLKNPRGDVAVMLITFGLTVLIDLTVAIEVGMVLAVFLFMQKMASSSNVEVFRQELKAGEEEGVETTRLKKQHIPAGVEIYEINGPFFFGAADKFKEAMSVIEKSPKVRILRMRLVPTIDATGIHVLEDVYHQCRKKGCTLVLSGIQIQPLAALKQAGMIERIGKENVHLHLEAALKRARELVGKRS